MWLQHLHRIHTISNYTFVLPYLLLVYTVPPTQNTSVYTFQLTVCFPLWVALKCYFAVSSADIMEIFTTSTPERMKKSMTITEKVEMIRRVKVDGRRWISSVSTKWMSLPSMLFTKTKVSFSEWLKWWGRTWYLPGKLCWLIPSYMLADYVEFLKPVENKEDCEISQGDLHRIA